jgi:exodeoxyribonuclease III
MKIKHLSLILLLIGIIITGWIAKPEKRFKIITYNVWNGFIDGINPGYPCYHVGKERKDGIYKWLKKQNADVVVFQELLDYTSEKLKEESSYWGHEYAVTLKDKGMAIGITSRYPIKIKEVLTTGMHHGLIYCNIEGIDIVGVHLWPRFDEKILDEVNIVKQRLSESLKNDIPVIVLGDFNAFSPEDDPYITQETIDLYNHWNWKTENGRPSYRVIQALIDLGLKDLYVKFRNKKYYAGGRYDFIFASPALAEKCLKATHPDKKKFLKLSDHFPVSAEFEWK